MSGSVAMECRMLVLVLVALSHYGSAGVLYNPYYGQLGGFAGYRFPVYNEQAAASTNRDPSLYLFNQQYQAPRLAHAATNPGHYSFVTPHRQQQPLPLQIDYTRLPLQTQPQPLKSLPLFHNQVFHTFNPSPRLVSGFQPMVAHTTPAPEPIRNPPRKEQQEDEDEEESDEPSKYKQGFDFDDDFNPKFKFGSERVEDEDSSYRVHDDEEDEEEGDESAKDYVHSQPDRSKFSSQKRRQRKDRKPDVEYKSYKSYKSVKGDGDHEGRASDNIPVVYQEKKYRVNNWFISKSID